MAGEETQVPAVPEAVVAPEVADAAPVEPSAESPSPSSPHPLEPGGYRFNEIYARMKRAETEARELRDRTARLEGAEQARQRPAQQPTPQFFTPEALQGYVDAGRISPAQMANQLAWQQAQVAQAQAIKLQQVKQGLDTAEQTVRQYMSKIPDLRNQNSSEFKRIETACHKLGTRMGLPPTDIRVQEAALETVYGGLDQVERRTAIRDQDRRSRVPHAETASYGAGGGEPAAQDANPLAGIPQEQIDFWTRMKYTPKRMAEEARFYRKRGR